jgi:NitT/TauT family transport system substrate-binding protein
MKRSVHEIPRRHLLWSTAAAGYAVPAMRALAADVPALQGAPRKVARAWMLAALHHSAMPGADKRGFFTRHNLDVEFVNWAGLIDLLLEAISPGKADAGVGMVLRWLKPMEQGFDVKLTAGTHGGCMHVLAAPGSGLKSLTDLRGKRLGVGDISGMDKNFLSIVLQKKGVDPLTEVEWKQFPPDRRGIALNRREIGALSTGDPLGYILKRDNGFVEMANNLESGYESGVPCPGIRGSLIRNDTPAAAAITRAVIEAAQWASENPEESGKIYAPRQRGCDLAEMLQSVTSDHHPVQRNFEQEIAFDVNDLKSAGVMKPSVDPAKFAGRVSADVLS